MAGASHVDMGRRMVERIDHETKPMRAVNNNHDTNNPSVGLFKWRLWRPEGGNRSIITLNG